MHWLPITIGKKKGEKIQICRNFLHDPVPSIAGRLSLLVKKAGTSSCLSCSPVHVVYNFTLKQTRLRLCTGFSNEYGLSCVIGLLGRLRAAATHEQHYPQMTQ